MHWGGVAFTVEQPDFSTPAGVKDRYIEMVQSHGTMQLSMGAAKIPGIVTVTRKFTLRVTPDETGEPCEPTEKTLMDILRMMEIADKKVWPCIVRESNSIHTGGTSPAWSRKLKHMLQPSFIVPRLRCTTG